MAMQKKVLVAYYSRTGNTERVAKDVAAKLGADIERITDKRDRKGFFGFLFGGRDAARKFKTEIGEPVKDPANYDITVVGTPVWAWNMTPAVRTYIEKNKSRLNDIALFVTSGSTGSDKIAACMEELSGKKAASVAGFTSTDMKKKNAYSEKIDSFADALKRRGF